MKTLLLAVKDGSLPVEQAVEQISRLPYENLGFARLDHHRRLRQGFPEVIYCEGKTVEQVVTIFARLADHNPNVLATRATDEMARSVRDKVPDAEFEAGARAIYLWRDREIRGRGPIVVVSAGTADMSVAREAVITARVTGNEVDEILDVGVAGIHRLMDVLPRLSRAKVVIVVAGMEGALASVVGGLIAAPVIAVPTSVGYGVSVGGLSALLSMLTSCVAGILVVNIDNGFGAGFAASLINRP